MTLYSKEELNKTLWDEFIEEVERRGFYNEENDFFMPCNDDGEEIEELVEEFFKKANVTYKTTVERAYDSPGYDSWILVVAWIPDGTVELELETLLLECC